MQTLLWVIVGLGLIGTVALNTVVARYIIEAKRARDEAAEITATMKWKSMSKAPLNRPVLVIFKGHEVDKAICIGSEGAWRKYATYQFYGIDPIGWMDVPAQFAEPVEAVS